MPLPKRQLSPVNISLHRLPASVQSDELQCVANGTLANLVRQLSSLSRHAEHIFGEIYHEVVKLDHKTNTLSQRIERLTHKVTQLDCTQEQVSLEDLHMRKAFKSSSLIDQHTLDRQTLPSALAECYATCDSPPNLDALNPYRDDKKSALKYYTDPSYFFDLWRQEMLKDVGDGRRAKAVKSPTENKSPRKKRSKQPCPNDAVRQAPLSARYIAATQQRPSDIMHFPAEYQAPQIVRMEQVQAPAGMSVPTSNGYTAPPAAAPTSINLPSPIPEETLSVVPPSKSVSHQLAHLELDDDPLMDDDDLPPPPPPLMHTSLVCQMPTPPAMQFLPPSEESVAPPPPPPPPPPVPSSASQNAVASSFANAAAAEEAKIKKPSLEQTTRSNLLAEIQSGIKLKQVERKEQAAKEKAAAEANDVAAILRRRMEHVMGNSDSNSDSNSDDDEWD
uniref:Wiskott-Aldrich syndrome protein family member n=1 Tax=Parascaris univalens TaxID=6257 RepID=A0A915B3B2_PARUN